MAALGYTRQRIVLADSLRGFALMGLFIVHMIEYFELYWYKPEPGWVHDSVFFLFGGKSYGIFALLFGLSFYIILDNYAKRGVDFRLRFIWRISLLFAIGYTHSLLYAGEILQVLALCGFLLVFTHRLSTTWLAVIAGIFLCQAPTAVQVLIHNVWPDPAYQQPVFIPLAANNFEVFAHGSLLDLFKHNAVNGQLAKWAFFIETGRLWNTIGLMFAGVCLGRIGFFEHCHRSKYLIIGTAISLMLAYALQLLATTSPPLAGLALWSYSQIVVYLQNLALISATILIIKLVSNTKFGNSVLSLWAPPGRMTLSFYLLQSCIFIPLFYGFDAVWYVSIGQTNSLILAVLVWALQMYMARVWLQHYSYGPVEKLWRVATFYRSKEGASPSLSNEYNK